MQLEYKNKSCWETYASAEDEVQKFALSYVDFLSRCKTERETVSYVTDQLAKAGFKEEFSADRVYRAHKNKTVFLARRGRRPLSEGIRLLGAHADTPHLDLKQRPLTEECEVALGKTHYYGGIRKYHWLSRPLALHGTIVKTDGSVIPVEIGEKPEDPVLCISDLLPHLASKQMDKKLSDAFEAEKLNVMLGHKPDLELGEEEKNKVYKNLLKVLNAKFGIVEEDLYSSEMQVVPAGPARFAGLDGALIGAYGHDDRICVYTGLNAFLQAEDPEYTCVAIFWDKEEIGSDGSTGAKSLFMEYCLEDLLAAWESETNIRTLFQKTRAVSADVHGAMDPDYQDVHEKLNASLIGHGPVFCKFTGHRGKIGANDAHAEYVAWWRRILNDRDIPWQMAELGKVDQGGGGTVAKHLAIYGMDIIDFGPGVLGMHSPFEIASKADVYGTYQAYKAFYEAGAD